MTDQTNQCNHHTLHAACITKLKSDYEKLNTSHTSDISDVHNKIDAGFNCRITNNILIFILVLFSSCGLFLFSMATGISASNLAMIQENSTAIKDNTTEMNHLKLEILESLKDIKQIVSVP